jgi:hypothetical protein
MWTTFYSTLNYRRLFNDPQRQHTGRLQPGIQYRQVSSRIQSSFPTNTLKELDAGAALDQSTGGSASEWAIRSFFGRAMYDSRASTCWKQTHALTELPGLPGYPLGFLPFCFSRLEDFPGVVYATDFMVG